MPSIPDVVRMSKLEAALDREARCTTHVRLIAESKTSRRMIRQEEKWQYKSALGEGGSGIVWSELCIEGDKKGEVRAVKKIPKLRSGNYFKELEAIALFSNEKFAEEKHKQCFVRSFGWFESPDSILISMEYVSSGDLQHYLGSPLPECEGQHIISQLLEGLASMHETGYAHRDLKPANILVVSPGPSWWVKIADFGISKRAEEGLTALRTVTGTPAFMAPEVLGFVHLSEDQADSYTNAVDIWSLGVISFLILTGETLFKEQRQLGKYIRDGSDMTADILASNKVSADGRDFLKSSMAIDPGKRPEVKECQQHLWLASLPEVTVEAREFERPETPLDRSQQSEWLPSASWSTVTEHRTDIEDVPLSTQLHQMRMSESLGHGKSDELVPNDSKEKARVAVSSHQHANAIAPEVLTEDTISKDSPSEMQWCSLRPALNDPHLDSWHTLCPRGEVYVQLFKDGRVVIKQTRRPFSQVTRICKLESFRSILCSIALSSKGEQLGLGWVDGEISIYDTETGRCLRNVVGASGKVHCIAYMPTLDLTQLHIAWVSDNTCQYISPMNGTAQTVVDSQHAIGPVSCIAYSSQTVRDFIAIGSTEGKILLMSYPSGNLVKQLSDGQFATPIWSLALVQNLHKQLTITYLTDNGTVLTRFTEGQSSVILVEWPRTTTHVCFSTMWRPRTLFAVTMSGSFLRGAIVERIQFGSDRPFFPIA